MVHGRKNVADVQLRTAEQSDIAIENLSRIMTREAVWLARVVRA
jgi:hypothetical protein